MTGETAALKRFATSFEGRIYQAQRLGWLTESDYPTVCIGVFSELKDCLPQGNLAPQFTKVKEKILLIYSPPILYHTWIEMIIKEFPVEITPAIRNKAFKRSIDPDVIQLVAAITVFSTAIHQNWLYWDEVAP